VQFCSRSDSDIDSFSQLVLLSLGQEFLGGYVAIADGEKDPRNLLIAFAITRVILIEFNITAHVEVRQYPLYSLY
jgi:hypothetical protein